MSQGSRHTARLQAKSSGKALSTAFPEEPVLVQWGPSTAIAPADGQQAAELGPEEDTNAITSRWLSKLEQPKNGMAVQLQCTVAADSNEVCARTGSSV
jgi:hypothetical protein